MDLNKTMAHDSSEPLDSEEEMHPLLIKVALLKDLFVHKTRATHPPSYLAGL